MLKLDNNALIRDQAYIDGEWRGARSGERFPVKNPATGEVIAEVADLSEVETREAIEAAHRAFPSWRAKTAKERALIMRRWYELMMAAQEDLAQLMTAEQGKPLSESRGEIAYGASFIEWFAEEGKRVYGDVIPGNAPFIVFDDADLDAAVKGAIASKFRNMGQTCVCANRFLVQDGVYDAFSEKLKQAVGALKVGDGMTPGVEQGPLINMAAVEKVEHLIADGVQHGAKVALGGKRHKLGGTFFEPTVIRDATPEMEFAREEIFGPVATLFRFKDDADAIRMANDTEYGLASYFYARDVGRIFRVTEGLEYGIIGVNEGIISTELAPFWGMQESAMGRAGSQYGIEGFLEIKYVALGGLGMP